MSVEERMRLFAKIEGVLREWSPLPLNMDFLCFLVEQEHGIDGYEVAHLVWAMLDFGLLTMTRERRISLPDIEGVY